MKTPVTSIVMCIAALCLSHATFAAGFTKKQLETWFNSDFDGPPEKYFQKQKPINGGKLTFLPHARADRVMHSHNTVTITHKSIDTGWVKLKQCYYNLDAFPRVEAIFRYRFFRKLKVLSVKGVDKARVKGKSIQMINVRKGASLCTQSEIRVFYQNKDKTFSLVNGPFSRRYLDGYFPIRVTLDVRYPEGMLDYISANHHNQPGLRLTRQAGNIRLAAIFEGKMVTQMRFRLRRRALHERKSSM
jgi:hypothetical protein